MYVAPLVFVLDEVFLILNPLDKKSHQVLPVLSASTRFASKAFPTTFVGFLVESKSSHCVPDALEHLIITYAGLNPVKTNGPSELPLPV
jgi:hypothetical protein